ncbi:MAG: class II glutamine amidotransferase [Actinobacteria bacterium]|nr:class II glutamine amidotransferase [Actinomycetota bacterium]
MCRLLAYCAAGPVSAADVMGEAGFSDFTALSEFHSDGWGAAWYDGDRLDVRKSHRRAAGDPLYQRLGHSRLGDAGLLHLRWATPGMPLRSRDAHPFRHGGLAMAHNGAIHPQDRLGELLPAAWEQRLTSGSDSERYFLHVMSRLDAHGGDLPAAVADTAARIRRGFRPNSLNAVFLAADAVYAVSWHDPANIPAAALLDRGYTGPPEYLAGYFHLSYRVTEQAVVVASSGWPQRGWELLPNGSVLVIDRATRSTRVEPLPEDSLTPG